MSGNLTTKVYVDSITTKQQLIDLATDLGYLHPNAYHVANGLSSFLTSLYNTNLYIVPGHTLLAPRCSRVPDKLITLNLVYEVLTGFPQHFGLTPTDWDILLINIANKIIAPQPPTAYPISTIMQYTTQSFTTPDIRDPNLHIYSINVTENIRSDPQDKTSKIQLPPFLDPTLYTDARPPYNPDPMNPDRYFVMGPTHNYANHWFLPWCNRVRINVELTDQQLQAILALCFHWHIWPPKGTTNEAIISIVLEALIHHILIPQPQAQALAQA